MTPSIIEELEDEGQVMEEDYEEMEGMSDPYRKL